MYRLTCTVQSHTPLSSLTLTNELPSFPSHKYPLEVSFYNGLPIRFNISIPSSDSPQNSPTMPALDVSMEGVEYHTIPSFKFTSGVTKDVKVAYRSFNPSAEKTVLIPTCYGGRVNDTTNFTDGAFKNYHVIVAAMLGNGESSSPSNDPDFPADYSLRYEDCINAHYDLATRGLGVKQLNAVVGFSMGGQQAYYWAVMHGSGANPFVKNVVPICGSAKTSGHNYAFLEGPIAALTQSADYAGGKYKANGVWPAQGLRAFGRAYAAWLTSAEWFRQELWRNLGAASLKDWLFPPGARQGSRVGILRIYSPWRRCGRRLMWELLLAMETTRKRWRELRRGSW